jgi:hypothetical protein
MSGSEEDKRTINSWEDVDTIASNPIAYRPRNWKREVEFWDLFRFLRLRPSLDLPFELQKCETPDFTISNLNTGTTTGVEITEAAHQAYEDVLAVARRTDSLIYQVSRPAMERVQAKRAKAVMKFAEANQDDNAIWHWHPHEMMRAKSGEVKKAVAEKSRKKYRPHDGLMLVIIDRAPLRLSLMELNTTFCKFLSEQYDADNNLFAAIYFVTECPKQNEDVLIRVGPDCRVISRRAYSGALRALGLRGRAD